MTDTPDLKARAGDLLCFTTGEYSDYHLKGHFVALENITAEHFQEAKEDAEEKHRIADQAQDAWRVERAGPYPLSVTKSEAFIAALIRAGLLVSVAVTELHIGSYGDIDL